MDILNKSPRGTKIPSGLLRHFKGVPDDLIIEPALLTQYLNEITYLDKITTTTNYGCMIPRAPMFAYFGKKNGDKMRKWITQYTPIIQKLQKEELRIYSAGCIGIGTTTPSPSLALHVYNPNTGNYSLMYPVVWYPVYFEAFKYKKRNCTAVSIAFPIKMLKQKISYTPGYYYLKKPKEIRISRLVVTNKTEVVRKQIIQLLKEANSFFLTNSQN